MPPLQQHAVVSVHSTRVLSHDEGSVLVETGSFTPMRWFLEQGLQSIDDSDDEPPKKKRRTTDGAQTKTTKSEVKEHVDAIPMSRVRIDLQFPDTLTSKPPKRTSTDLDDEFGNAECVDVVPTIIDLFEDGTRLKLADPRDKGAVLMVDLADPPEATLDALRTIAVSRMQKVDKRSLQYSENPATWPRCTLSRSQHGKHNVVRLEATLFWNSGVSAFPAGVPVGRSRVYPDYESLLQSFPDKAREEVDHSRAWTPADFYDSVHVPSKHIATQGKFDGVLESELYPFQKRAVHWMLEREGVQYEGGEVQKIRRREARPGIKLFEETEDIDGNKCYVNHLQGIVQRRSAGRDTTAPDEDDSYHLSGGILAEEMGLGKTVELMALLRLHKPRGITGKTVLDEFGNEIPSSRATLIITPSTILQQWQSELTRHAPSLKVHVYKGIASVKAKAQKKWIDELLWDYDVILTTYNTLTREIHFAEDPPEREMRHPPKFERKRSPLVGIKWWRVCLDEAQMVESGVTAAARVARRLPRVYSWAVSGTPLRRDVQDLHGLLIFLRYHPICDSPKLWSHLVANHRHIFQRIFGAIALRHTKAHIREDLNLPAQKRVVITVPFSAIEQQHYDTLFTEMCEAVGVTTNGSPKSGEWDPEDPATVEAMRDFLRRLRQTCLHPQVGGKNRKALGRGAGPLRTVAEVLEIMIDQKETSIRTEERTLLASQLLRAHILGNAKDDDHRSEKALEIYLDATETSARFVKDARARLIAAREAQGDAGEGTLETDDDEDSSSESTPILGRLRNSLRTALQLQHTCTFFAATAYFQIKSNEKLTAPDSDRFKELEQKEIGLYESAKLIRKEILKESSRKAENYMRKIQTLDQNDNFTRIPDLKDLESFGGISNRRIVEKSDNLFDIIREQTKVLADWRKKMAQYLLKPLVDEDEGIETTGDEYEDSTKLQDELYAYFDACKAMQADLNHYITDEDTPLIDHEAKVLVKAAKNLLNKDIIDEVKVQVHAPELTLELFAIRNKLIERRKELGSVRALIQEARSIETSLQGHESGPRAMEKTFVHRHLVALQSVFSSFTKTLEALEKEVDLFRVTQNHRIEFYRQLQELSDAVRPHKEELDDTLDLATLEAVTDREEQQSNSLDKLKTQNRYLLSLREESSAQSGPKICVICQYPFESGVLTVCGHQFCKDCIHHWWSEHKTCPVCKRQLKTADFHNITYKPKELRAQEENNSGSSSPSEPTSSPSRPTSIYSDVDNQLMQEIKSIDLPVSYGTKIDTVGRHLHWIREHDPGAKSIVFSQYREFLDVLGTALNDFKIGHVRLGRANAVEKFRHDPSVDCLLLDAKTDSSGLTLVNATHVFICEPLIQTAVELQAIARVHRIGQTRPTTVWMYLVNDTVEESIYEISVARRLAHVQSRQSNRAQKSRSATPALLGENAIDVANSEELQSAPISKLLVPGKGGGEVVGKDDLWQCLFGKAQDADGTVKPSVETEMVVGRFRRAEAAEQRRRDAVNVASS